MALNLADRITIMDSQVMQMRVRGAVINYALYLLGGSPTDPQKAWAKGALDDPQGMGAKVSRHLLDDTNFLNGGSDITDNQLKGAAETAINARFIV